MPKVPTPQEAQRLRGQNPTGLGRTPSMGEAVKGFGRSLQQVAQIEDRKKKLKDTLDEDEYNVGLEIRLKHANNLISNNQHKGSASEFLKSTKDIYDEEVLPKYGSHLHRRMKIRGDNTYSVALDKALLFEKQLTSAEIKEQYNNLLLEDIKKVKEDPTQLMSALSNADIRFKKYNIDMMGQNEQLASIQAIKYKKRLATNAADSFANNGQYKQAIDVIKNVGLFTSTEIKNAVKQYKSEEHTNITQNHRQSEIERTKEERELKDKINKRYQSFVRQMMFPPEQLVPVAPGSRFKKVVKMSLDESIRMSRQVIEKDFKDGKISYEEFKELNKVPNELVEERSKTTDMQLSRLAITASADEVEDTITNKLRTLHLDAATASKWYRRIPQMKSLNKYQRVELSEALRWVDSRFVSNSKLRGKRRSYLIRANRDARMKFLSYAASGEFPSLRHAALAAVQDYRPEAGGANSFNVIGVPAKDQTNLPDLMKAARKLYENKRVLMDQGKWTNADEEKLKDTLNDIKFKTELFKAAEEWEKTPDTKKQRIDQLIMETYDIIKQEDAFGDIMIDTQPLLKR